MEDAAHVELGQIAESSLLGAESERAEPTVTPIVLQRVLVVLEQVLRLLQYPLEELC